MRYPLRYEAMPRIHTRIYIRIYWLRRRDSNPYNESQSLVSCRLNDAAVIKNISTGSVEHSLASADSVIENGGSPASAHLRSNSSNEMEHRAGLEPASSCLEGKRIVLSSHRRICGRPGETRTRDLADSESGALVLLSYEPTSNSCAGKIIFF